MRRGDLGIRDGRFAPAEGEALRELDAEGLIAAPGFMDIHSHGDLALAGADPRRDFLHSLTGNGLPADLVLFDMWRRSRTGPHSAIRGRARRESTRPS